MSLSIGIGDGTSFAPLPSEPSLDLHDDGGYYWFLAPLIEELAQKTGHYIDLYGDASFLHENLKALEGMLIKARQLVNDHEAAWDVCIGEQLVPYQKATKQPAQMKRIYSRVEKR